MSRGIGGLAQLLASVKHRARFLILVGVTLPLDWRAICNEETGIEAVVCVGQVIAPFSRTSLCLSVVALLFFF